MALCCIVTEQLATLVHGTLYCIVAEQLAALVHGTLYCSIGICKANISQHSESQNRKIKYTYFHTVTV
jgi:hypothetical protein